MVFQSQTRRLLPRNSSKRYVAHYSGLFQSQTRRLLPRNRMYSAGRAHACLCFNRRRDACFPATACRGRKKARKEEFQSQTRRLLPRNGRMRTPFFQSIDVSIADATLASPQRERESRCIPVRESFNRRRDACFPATVASTASIGRFAVVSIADATLASPQPSSSPSFAQWQQDVSIADATLASPQQGVRAGRVKLLLVSIADATLASPQLSQKANNHIASISFNRRRDACFPATGAKWKLAHWIVSVSIADATLASPQPLRPDAPAIALSTFQSQTRRLLPRNNSSLE